MKDATEASFQDQIVSLAVLQGWAAAHFRPAQTKDGWRTAGSYDSKGFPDLLMIQPAKGWIIVAELKGPRGVYSDDQIKWLRWFTRAKVAAYRWTEKDWLEIETVLREGPK